MSERPAAAHERHDLELVARAAAGDLAVSEAIAARDLLASCEACASIAADLRAIAVATRALPSASSLAAATRTPRDFRLTRADARRLRREGVLGLRGRFGVGRTGFGDIARGLGGALATLGLVGLLVSVGIPALGGGLGAGAGAGREVSSAANPASAATAATAASKDNASPAPAPDASGVGAALYATDSAIRTEGAIPTESQVPGPGTSSATPWTIAAGVSVVLLGAGIALVLIGWRSRRGHQREAEGT